MAKLEMPIRETIQAYCRDTAGEHDRDRSWEHCYRYFKLHSPEKLAADRSHAALQLGFYLASWGMYRGSCFLLKYAYTAHLGVIEQLAAPEFTSLWQHEFGPTEDGRKLIPVILASVTAIREAYRPFAPNSEDRQASDTLVTKILLGTFGCFPACDRYFIDGTKSVGLKGRYVNSKLIEDLLAFCSEHLAEFQTERAALEKASGFRFPLMKVVDMYFWQVGYRLEVTKTALSPTTTF
jgi:hypothetical protein